MRCPTLRELPPPPSGKTGWPWTAESEQLPETMPALPIPSGTEGSDVEGASGDPWPRVSIVTPSYNQGQFIEETKLAGMNKPQISVVLGSYNRLAFLKGAIASIRDNGITVPYETLVVDGGSTDGSMQWLARQKDIITIIQHNRGTVRQKPIERRSWGYFMNLGFKCAQGKFILMISDDCLLVPGAVQNGMRHFEALLAEGRKIGAVAFYWRNWPGQKDYWVGLTLGGKMFVNHGMYLRQALEHVGWIDEERYQFYHADGDLCLKLWKQGYKVIDCPDAFVEHFTHANYKIRQSNMRQQAADWEAYLSRWSGIFYQPDRPNVGSWIYHQYVDPHDTVARFPKRAVILLLARKRFAPLLARLRQWEKDFTS